MEFALNEIFNYYARNYTSEFASFDQYSEQLFKMSCKGYLAFTIDFRIDVDKPRVMKFLKKRFEGRQDYTYDEFRDSLPSLALCIYEDKIDRNKQTIG